MRRFLVFLVAGLVFASARSQTVQLAANDGWASLGKGTTGGSMAHRNHVFSVRNRRELIAALNDGVYPPRSAAPSNQPKLIYVEGVIDANVDDKNLPLSCQDYNRDGYSLDAFLAVYDPKVWGRSMPTGKAESARVASHQAQQERVQIRIGSNTTLVGSEHGATLKGAWLDIQSQSNVIVSNIKFLATYDCFPGWEPNDGAQGAWNSEYDFISVRASDHVWIDHNSFDDGADGDSQQPHYFGQPYQTHDGEVDITNAADLVTVSWNRFVNHDKTMLIGSSDTRLQDRGRLRVTLHHNLFENVGQRTPRVRFGLVHVYNNYYRIPSGSRYQYSWGVGTESRIYAENNAFVSDVSIEPARLIRVFKGDTLHASGTLLNNLDVDVVAAFNGAHDSGLARDVRWSPKLHTKIDAVRDVAALVTASAGPRDH